MAFVERVPHPALRPYVDRLWLSTPDAMKADGPERILPDGCIDLHLCLDAGPRLEVVGTMTRALVLEAPVKSTIVAVRFKPGGAVPFLRVNAADLTDLTIEATALDLPWLHWEAGEQHPADALLALETLLLRSLRDTPAPDRLIAHAVSRLLARSAPPVAELAKELGMSRQHLARRFQSQVGIAPKELSRIARMQRAVTLLQARPQAGIAGLALELGYYDQAHLAKDLRELSFATARDVREHAGSILPIRSLLPELESSACNPSRAT